MVRRLKVLNDPVYGFITLSDELLLEVLDQPVVQRLRRIRQMGLAHLVYPGATHHRLLHALGTMHLTARTLQNFRDQDIPFTTEERLALLVATLLHDVGHGPFSHALEGALSEVGSHEALSALILETLIPLPEEIRSKALHMLQGTYPVAWFNHMVASQLDMDRLDYLGRDSFFTGVSEGVIGSERILSLLTVSDGLLAIEEKGIYSVEKFLLARHLMYWQVYLHKTVLSAEFHLLNILRLARTLWKQGEAVSMPHNLERLLIASTPREKLEAFAQLDDADISYGIKMWAGSKDPWLRDLCCRLLERRLFKTFILPTAPSPELLETLRNRVTNRLGQGADSYYLYHGPLINDYYHCDHMPILVRTKKGQLLPAHRISPTIDALARNIVTQKYFVMIPDFLARDEQLTENFSFL
ncbi:MAG: HD domain-containing protein [Flavobacteriales bacterium]|nr:HD domain-containing protein [Flavobacteriales bacterium]